MSQQLSGKTAIVSGAANGIGLAVARRFLEAGANVMLTDIDEDKLEAETEALEAPEKAQFFPDRIRLTPNRTPLMHLWSKMSKSRSD